MADTKQAILTWLRHLEETHKHNAKQLEVTKWRWVGNAAMLLKHGQWFSVKPRPRNIVPGIIKACFFNAWTVANEIPDRYVYCEGYYNDADFFPIEHAWLMDRLDGKAVEVTLRNVSHEAVYFGLAFKLDYVNKIARETGYTGVIENFRQGYPLLRGVHRLEDVIYTRENIQNGS